MIYMSLYIMCQVLIKLGFEFEEMCLSTHTLPEISGHSMLFTETSVFLMNVFFALKGSKLFIIIYITL